MTKKEKGAACLGVALFLLAAVFSISLILGLLDFGNSSGAFFWLGKVLIEAYGFCSVLIPVYFFTAGIFCFISKWTLQKAVGLLISPLPFFTLALAEQTSRKIASTDISSVALMKIVFLVVIAILLAFAEYLLSFIISSKIYSKKHNSLKTQENSEVSSENQLDSLTLKAEEENSEVLEEDESPVQDDSVAADDEKLPEENKILNDDIWSLDEDGNAKNSSPEEEKFADETENSAVEAKNSADEAEIPDEKPNFSSKEEDFSKNEDALDIKIQDPWNVIQESKALGDVEQKDFTNLVNPIFNDSKKAQEFEEKTEQESDEFDDIISSFEKDSIGFEENSEKKADEIHYEINFEENPADENEFPDEKINSNDEINFSSEEEFPGKDEAAAEENNFADEKKIPNVNKEDEFVELPDFSDEEKQNDDELDAAINDAISYDDELAGEETNSFDENEFSGEEINSGSKEENFFDENTSKVQQEDKTIDLETDENSDETDINSNLSDIFSKMDQDIKENLESENQFKNQNEEKSQNQQENKNSLEATETNKTKNFGKTAFYTDKNGNTKPIELSIKKAHGPYEISTELLKKYEQNPFWEIDDETKEAALNLQATLREFNIEADVTAIRRGPVVTMFEILPAPGVNLNKIRSLQDNIALRLAAKSVRIVAPIPGKRAVGIEIPNKKRAIVSFRECIEEDRPEWKKMQIPAVLGKDIEGVTQLMDLAKTPHLLIAGATGAGKSVCVNSMILSILYKRSPNEVKLILIDPKIVELSLYNGIGHLLTPVITEPKAAMQALNYCICEMERRYAVLKGMGCREIVGYNQKIKEQRIATEKLPYIVIVIDEFADLMASAGKQMEAAIARLAAKSRAVGIHLVLATQRPSVDVITGLIKANIPSRIAFMVASRTDSNIIIDKTGAEKLLGKGDMLYSSATDPFPIRIQGTFVSDQEVENVVDAVKDCWGEPEYIDDEIFIDDDEDEELEQNSLFNDGADDPLYEKALDIVIQAGKASASYIQRKLSIGYNRAARLVELMEERGIVGPANGSKPREIIHVP